MVVGLYRSILLATLTCITIRTFADEKWVEKWCELNDCYGIRAAESQKAAMAVIEKETRKATLR